MAKEDKKQTQAPEQDEDFNYIVRVANSDLDGKKPVVDALRKIKGVSFMFANAMCSVAGIDRNAITGKLSKSDIKKLQAVIDDPSAIPKWLLNRRKDYETGQDMHLVVNELIYQRDNDIKRLRKIKSYRGVRHSSDLPVRGQRTKSNFRKNKGKK